MGRFDIPQYNSLPQQPPSKLAAGDVASDGDRSNQVDETSNKLIAAFFFLGVGVLLSWNAMLSVMDYYSFLFPDISIAQYITNAYMFPVLVVGLLLSLTPFISRQRRLTIHTGFAGIALVSALLPVLVNNDQPVIGFAMSIRNNALRFTLIGSALIGTFCALLQSTIFGMINYFPGGLCTRAFTAGSGASSVIIITVRIFARILWDDPSTQITQSLHDGFRLFFLICLVLCLCCNLVFVWMDNFSPEYAHYVKERVMDVEEREAQHLFGQTRLTGRVLNDIMVPAISMAVSNMVTMLIFPGLLIQLPASFRNEISQIESSWYPLVVVYMFAIGDTIGKMLPSERLVLRYSPALLWLTSSRLLFIPVYLVFWSGFLPINWFLIIVIVLGHGFSHGFLVSFAFLAAPGQTTADRGEIAGKLMFVMLMFGLSLGSALGWAAEVWIRKAGLLP